MELVAVCQENKGDGRWTDFAFLRNARMTDQVGVQPGENLSVLGGQGVARKQGVMCSHM